MESAHGCLSPGQKPTTRQASTGHQFKSIGRHMVNTPWPSSAQVKSTHMPPFKSPRHPPICPPGGSPVRRLGRPPPRLPRSTRHHRRSRRNLLPLFSESRTCARMLIFLSSHAHLRPPPSFTSRTRCHASPAALNNANYVH